MSSLTGALRRASRQLAARHVAAALQHVCTTHHAQQAAQRRGRVLVGAVRHVRNAGRGTLHRYLLALDDQAVHFEEGASFHG